MSQIFEGDESIVGTIEAAAERYPDQTAVIDASRFLSFGGLLQESRALAERIHSKCEPEAQIGVLLDNSVETAVAYLGCLLARRVYVPLAHYPDSMMPHVLTVLKLQAVIARPGMHLVVRGGPSVIDIETEGQVVGTSLPPSDASAVAHILLTSGTTTGVAKAVATDQLASLYSHRWRTALCPYQDDGVVGLAGLFRCCLAGYWPVHSTPTQHTS